MFDPGPAHPQRLPVTERRELVRQLAAAGWSFTRIAAAVGVSKTQAMKDRRPPAVRPPVDRAACGRRRGAGLGNHRRPLPKPTSARPGTPEKMATLERRAEDGFELWHPLDPV